MGCEPIPSFLQLSSHPIAYRPSLLITEPHGACCIGSTALRSDSRSRAMQQIPAGRSLMPGDGDEANMTSAVVTTKGLPQEMLQRPMNVMCV